jgi:Flp pilus assembly protein TadD
MALRKWGAVALAVAITPFTWARDTSWFDEPSLQTAMITDRPTDPESRFAAAMMLLREGDIERAYPLCRAYAEARPDSEKANFCVGSWLLLHHKPAEAVTALRPYALSRPGMETARRAFLAALLASRQYDEARQTVEDWSRAFAGAPDLEEARATLASMPRGAASASEAR